jgi:hypothetical protein
VALLLCFGFRSLVRVLVLIRLLFFFYSQNWLLWCVVNALIKGAIEEEERPRTSGGSCPFYDE